MGTLALRVTGATLRYPQRVLPVLDGLDFTVESGEVVALVGPSGGGKSSLLRAIAGLERLDRGRIEILAGHSDEVQAVTANGRGHLAPGIAFQEPLLLPWLTVAENVALGRRYAANRRVESPAIDDLLDQFGLRGVRNAYPSELSGGQAQRASVARAVAVRPAVLLLDEPFGAVDPATRRGLQDWLRSVVLAWGLTVVIVTHDLAEAIALGDRIALIDGSGKVARTFVTEGAGPSLAHDILACFPSHRPTASLAGSAYLPVGTGWARAESQFAT